MGSGNLVPARLCLSARRRSRSTRKPAMSNKCRQTGMSLIEVVLFIVVLGIGFAGILVLYNQVSKASVDPIVRKQALAIASSLLEEIELRAFTYCDPDDPAVFTATSAADCSAGKDE